MSVAGIMIFRAYRFEINMKALVYNIRCFISHKTALAWGQVRPKSTKMVFSGPIKQVNRHVVEQIFKKKPFLRTMTGYN